MFQNYELCSKPPNTKQFLGADFYDLSTFCKFDHSFL